MRSVQIRELFRAFFRARDHQVVSSSSLIPDDPSVLLTTAGMVQFKPYFLGERVPPNPRLTSRQKCVRTVDIDKIGQTDRHATFFEMLGNFSFGDYQKRQAIAWAYELLTGHVGLDPSRLWATVYQTDEESVELWRDQGIPAERIQRLGMADNYWDAGEGGPCGPCSEIFYDRGPRYGRAGGPAVNPERYLEVWNLVFMRHIRGVGGTDEDFPLAGDLPQPCIESGLGLERLAVITQGVDNVHETDQLAPVLGRLAELANRPYPPADAANRRSMRIVVDHVRAGVFLSCDGVVPASDGRGYVLRRLIRRALHHSRRLGLTGTALGDLAGTTIDCHGEVWPELVTQRPVIEHTMASEEAAFDRTLQHGSRLLDQAIRRTQDRSSSTLPADAAFQLHDTHGFPLELTLEIAADAGLTVDTDRVAALVEEQRRRARDARSAPTAGADSTPYTRLATRLPTTSFVGHESLAADGTVQALVAGDREISVGRAGQRVDVVLDRTPMYAESGGQVGDTGTIHTTDGSLLKIIDTVFGAAKLRVHRAEVVHGEVRVGATVETAVDADRRRSTARAHTATHVLHAVLRQTIGDHARQRGSLVSPGRLRFDFRHGAAMSDDARAELEAELNRLVLDDPVVRVWETSYDEAVAAGATALFGEKYGPTVRVVDIGDFSRELCGGTHVEHGSQVGPVRIVAESSVGTGLRRIEALAGFDALTQADRERQLLHEVTRLLGDPHPDRLVERLRDRLTSLATAEKDLAAIARREQASLAERLASQRVDRGPGWLIAERLAEQDSGELRAIAEQILSRSPQQLPEAVLLGRGGDGSAQLVACATGALAARLSGSGTSMRELLVPAGDVLGGGCGGSDTLAFAGGRHAERIDEALRVASGAVSRLLERSD